MPRRKHNPLCRPFLKWAGGKRQLLPELQKHVPKQFGTYYEPFLGGGALFLALQRPRAVVNDSNRELINCFEVVRDSVEDLLLTLEEHQAHNAEEYYYAVRDWDRVADFMLRSPIQRAARIIYLNKTCYNGLFRVNAQGQFNVPYGRYTKPNIVDDGVLRAVSNYLNSAEVEFRCQDFVDATHDARKGDFIYFDPPYDPISDTAAFTGYDVNGFGKAEQDRLHQHFRELTTRDCLVMLSNAHTDFIKKLYTGFPCLTVEATRAINSVPQKRGKVEEVLVLNYVQQRAARRTSRRTGSKQRSSVGEAVSAVSDTGPSKSLWPVRD